MADAGNLHGWLRCTDSWQVGTPGRVAGTMVFFSAGVATGSRGDDLPPSGVPLESQMIVLAHPVWAVDDGCFAGSPTIGGRVSG